MKPVYAKLRQSGHKITSFLDDMLILASTEDELKASVAAIAKFLLELGFVINWEKSVIKPSKKIQHLGFHIDSDSMLVTLPPDKVDNIIAMCRQLASKNSDTIRNVAKVIGSLVACFPAVFLGPLHYRYLEYEKDTALKGSRGNFEAYMPITDKMKEELHWWEMNVKFQSKPIVERTPTVTLSSDASLEGWGGAFGDDRTGG